MISHREMKTLAENPEAVRALARQLMALGAADPQVEWTDWEVDFLESMATRDSPEPLTMRQREVLSDLRTSAGRHSQVEGFKVRTLIESCWLQRSYLSADDNQRFIEDLKTAGQQSVTRRQLGRLLGCCREIGVLEEHHGFVLSSSSAR